MVDGALQDLDDGRQQIRFQRRLEHPVERVWTALTDPGELVAWWGDADVELVEGGTFTMRWLNTDEEGRSVTMTATITGLDPPHLLETSGDVHGTLRWELRSDGDGTILTVTSTLELPEEYRTMALAGWHWHLDALAGARGQACRPHKTRSRLGAAPSGVRGPGDQPPEPLTRARPDAPSQRGKRRASAEVPGWCPGG
jgi:uncharacterized protein YndB with AHSA1/START domain